MTWLQDQINAAIKPAQAMVVQGGKDAAAAIAAGQAASTQALASGNATSAADLSAGLSSSAGILGKGDAEAQGIIRAQQAANTSQSSPFISNGTTAMNAYMDAIGLPYQLTPGTPATAAQDYQAPTYVPGTAVKGTPTTTYTDASGKQYTNTTYGYMQGNVMTPGKTGIGIPDLPGSTVIGSGSNQYDIFPSTEPYYNYGQPGSTQGSFGGDQIQNINGQYYSVPSQYQELDPKNLQLAGYSRGGDGSLGGILGTAGALGNSQALSNYLGETTNVVSPNYHGNGGFGGATFTATPGKTLSPLLQDQNQLAADIMTPQRMKDMYIAQGYVPLTANTTYTGASPGTILDPGHAAMAATPGTAATYSTPSSVDTILSRFENSPGYQAMLKQGLAGINSNAAAQGLLGSGAQGEALTEFGANYAQTGYQNYLANLLGSANIGNTASGQLMSANSGLAGQGAGAAASLANQGSQGAVSLANQGSSAATSLANTGSNNATNAGIATGNALQTAANNQAKLQAGNLVVGNTAQIGFGSQTF